MAAVYRACAEAWAAGGLEAERRERESWETRDRRRIQDSLDAMATIREKALERRRLRELQERGRQTHFFTCTTHCSGTLGPFLHTQTDTHIMYT